MKLKNILIVVKDIEKSKQFYHDLLLKNWRNSIRQSNMSTDC